MKSHAYLSDARPVLQAIHDLLRARPEFKPRYDAAKTVVRAFRKPAFYEITQRCNLWCEGCYYFEGGMARTAGEQRSIAAWEAFFAEEASRQVTMAYFVGAEPALEQERLIAAAPHFPYGNIGTNGTIRIDPAVPYRIGVSVWAGDDASDKRMRGGSAFRKAFKNYAGDPRAIILYTLSRWNLGSVRHIAEMCRDHGLPLTFNMYSPTASFLDKLRRDSANDDKFFRSSRPGETPIFGDQDLLEARRLVSDLMDDFADTIIYSRPYNDWATGSGPLYEVDSEGVAIHCGSRIIGQMKYYGPDLMPTTVKCCTSDVDCSQCRMYSGGWSSKFQPSARDVASEAAFSDWLDMMQVLGRIFLYEGNRSSRPGMSVRAPTDALIAAE